MNKAPVGQLRKILSLRILFSIGVIGLSFVAALSLLHVLSPNNTTPASTAAPAPVAAVEPQKPKEFSPPERIEIPSISATAPVAGFGLTQNGDMDIDDAIDRTAWYNLGPKPGQKGSAVIAGHYGWKDGQKAIFSDIRKMNLGDPVHVYTGEGEKLTFIVKEMKMYDWLADATEVFTSDNTAARLNLITCEGAWNNSLQTYEDRLVVFTELQS